MQDDNKKEDIEKECQAYMNWYERVQQLKEKQRQHIIDRQKAAKKRVNEMPELRLDTFKQSNDRLSKNRSQVPNIIVQTRIFDAVQDGVQKHITDWEQVSTLGLDDVQVYRSGMQPLGQHDLTGWLAAIKFLDTQDMIARFTKYEFLKTLKQDNGRNYYWIDGYRDKEGIYHPGLFTRLRRAEFWIARNTEENQQYEGSLVLEVYRQDDDKVALKLSDPLYKLLGMGHWSFIDLQQRLLLGHKKKYLAQAFHAYLSTHTCPPNGLWWRKAELWRQWGPRYKSQVQFLKDFKRRVLKPLYELGFVSEVTTKPTAIGIKYCRRKG